VAAGTTKQPSRNPSRSVSVDVRCEPDADIPATAGAISNAKGSERKRLDPSYVGPHAVTRRLTCLIVVPALVIARVTPLPE
jgi:hypothetical protein